MSKENNNLKTQMTKLDELIAWFDQDDFDLDEALSKFDEGVKLADSIKKKLEVFDNKVKVLKERFDQTG